MNRTWKLHFTPTAWDLTGEFDKDDHKYRRELVYRVKGYKIERKLKKRDPISHEKEENKRFFNLSKEMNILLFHRPWVPSLGNHPDGKKNYSHNC